MSKVSESLFSDFIKISDSDMTSVKSKYDGVCYQIIGKRAFFTFNVEITVAMTSGTYYPVMADISKLGITNPKIRYINVNDSLRVQVNYNKLSICPLSGNLSTGTSLFFEFSIPVELI